MNLTWPQQHALNYQLKSEIDNHLTNSSEIKSWSFDSYQSNLLLGKKATDKRNLEPILINLPDLLAQNLAQNLAQLPPVSIPVESDIKVESRSNAKDLLPNQDRASGDKISGTQSLLETYRKEEITKKESPVVEILKHFEHLDDPRADANRDHKLGDIITIAILAVICGANHWTQIANFGQGKREWLSTFLELPSGIPSHDTFNRVFARLDPDQFRQGFISWVNSIRKAISGEVIAI